ncbi:MAG: FHA domain-containing protein [Streptosporangiaceae bacterium]
MPSVFCTQCGHANPGDARFCSQCGAPLTGSGQPVSPESPAETTSTISLTGIEALESDQQQEDDPAAEQAAALEALPTDSALLVVKRGPNAGSRFLLDSDLTTAGRHPESDIFLDDVTVSRRHAEFYRRGDTFAVRDVGSLNGTYVNRERIEETTLSGGDEVQIGKFRLVFLTSARQGDGQVAGRS